MTSKMSKRRRARRRVDPKRAAAIRKHPSFQRLKKKWKSLTVLERATLMSQILRDVPGKNQNLLAYLLGKDPRLIPYYLDKFGLRPRPPKILPAAEQHGTSLKEPVPIQTAAEELARWERGRWHYARHCGSELREAIKHLNYTVDPNKKDPQFHKTSDPKVKETADFARELCGTIDGALKALYLAEQFFDRPHHLDCW